MEQKRFARTALALLLALLWTAAGGAMAWAETPAIPNTAVGGLPMATVELTEGQAFTQEEIESINDGALLAAYNTTVVEALYDGMRNVSNAISLLNLGVTTANVSDYVNYVLACYPELFAVNRYSYSYSGASVIYVTPYYKLEGNEYFGTNLTTEVANQLRAQIATYHNGVDAIISLVDEDWTDIQTLLFLHDYLTVHYEYDYTYSNYDAYEMLTEKAAVCQGYTELYQGLLNELGIENALASSDAMNHIWNLVKLNGQWYHIDNTWDDPSAQPAANVYVNRLGLSGHENFLRSDNGIKTTNHHDWMSTVVENVTATATGYDSYFWQQVDSAFVQGNNCWYYIYNDMGDYSDTADDGLFCWDGLSSSGGSLVSNISDLWMAYSGSGYWPGTYAGLSSYYGRLVFNTPTQVCFYNPYTGLTSYASVTMDTSSGYAYGSRVDGNTLTYHTMTDPNGSNATVRTLTLPKVAAAATVTKMPNKTVYSPGQSLNTSGLTATLTFSDGSTQNKVAGNFTYTCDLSQLGQRTVTMWYIFYPVGSFQVTVAEPTVTGIEVATLPSKTTYFVGDTLDTTGLTLTATYNNGDQTTVSSGFSCSPASLTTAGDQTVTVTYQGKTCTFQVSVQAVALESIAVKSSPTKTAYFVGDTLNTAGLTLTATNNNGSQFTVTSGFSCSPTSLTIAGNQTVTVTYQGKTCTFQVSVQSYLKKGNIGGCQVKMKEDGSFTLHQEGGEAASVLVVAYDSAHRLLSCQLISGASLADYTGSLNLSGVDSVKIIALKADLTPVGLAL